MKNELGYNFHSPMKRRIEDLYYEMASNALKINESETISIVTGPRATEHIWNAKNHFSTKRIELYEIDEKIFDEVERQAKFHFFVSCKKESIENASSRFIDCDLTCKKDLDAIINTLKNQSSTHKSTIRNHKVFIWTVGLRSNSPGVFPIAQIANKVFNVLNAEVSKVTDSWTVESLGQWNRKHQLTLEMPKVGRIRRYLMYFYNAGGGPMLTCYIDYI